MEIMTFFWLVLICFPAMVWSHARLMSPPSRSSMWRVGFPTRKNFNDNALYCGGITVQWQTNGGKCGICGDPYNQPHPRENEAGGKYGKGVISKRYLSGQVIEATVDVTTNHRGYFEFKLCPNNNPKKEATQECLDKYVLEEAHGIGTRYYISDRGRGAITVKLQLPKGLTCSQCVFQWTYVAGNNWGRCKDGESRLGCGRQETFRGCADIAIEKSTDIFTFNEVVNDVDKLNNDHHHKNRKFEQPKDLNVTRNIDYTYEVSRHTHINTTRTDSGQNHLHQQDKKEFPLKNEDYLPSTHQHPEKPKLKNTLPNGQNNHGDVNRRKHDKYDKRHFYQLFNQTTVSPVSSGVVNSLNNKSSINTGHSLNNRTYHINESRNTGRTHKIYSALNSLSLGSNDKDFSMSQGFNLGGRRYKNFWLL